MRGLCQVSRKDEDEDGRYLRLTRSRLSRAVLCSAYSTTAQTDVNGLIDSFSIRSRG